MKSAARIYSLLVVLLFGFGLLRGFSFAQWRPIDITAAVVGGVLGVGLLRGGQTAGWYYLISCGALLAGVASYQQFGFWVVLDLIVIAVNVVVLVLLAVRGRDPCSPRANSDGADPQKPGGHNRAAH